MQRGRSSHEYEPVTRSRPRPGVSDGEAASEEWPTLSAAVADASAPVERTGEEEPPARGLRATKTGAAGFLKRGHALTYAALFLFTIILYTRPSELSTSPLVGSIALIVGIITLVVFVPSQLAVEGSITARPREINLLLLFSLTALLSIPLALSPAEAWATFFGDTFIRCVVIFVVMINVVRTEARLKGLLFLALLISLWLSLGALNDFRLGLTEVEGYRITGRGRGLFGNANDMALHLVTIVPIAVGLMFAARGGIGKIFYGICAALMMAAIVVTYSRGAFLAMMVALGFLAWKLGRKHRLLVTVLALLIGALFLALAPGNYGRRLLSIVFPNLDPVGSADARRGELFRSINVALHNPVFGVGMGNYATQMSARGLVTHNSYTQVAAELGVAALIFYTMFIVTPLRRLGQIARDTFGTREHSRYYYLSTGLQASLLAYIVASFFASVAYNWYPYYLVAYAVCLRRMYEAETGKLVVAEKRAERKKNRVRRFGQADSVDGAATAV